MPLLTTLPSLLSLQPPYPAAEASEEKLLAASGYIIDDLTGKIDQLEVELATARNNAEGAMSELQTLRGRYVR